MATPATAFGQRVRDLRKERKLSLQVAADHIGLSRSHLNNIELGRDLPGRETLLAMLTFYEVSLGWLAAKPGDVAPFEEAAARDADEALLLFAYRNLPPDEAAAILKLLLGRTKPVNN